MEHNDDHVSRDALGRYPDPSLQRRTAGELELEVGEHDARVQHLDHVPLVDEADLALQIEVLVVGGPVADQRIGGE